MTGHARERTIAVQEEITGQAPIKHLRAAKKQSSRSCEGNDMLRKAVRALKRMIISYETRRLQSNIINQSSKEKRTVRIVEYHQQYGCITLPEARWIFQHLERWSGYYMLYLIMAQAGLRQGEMCKLHLGSEGRPSSFKNDFWDIYYEVEKPRCKVNKRGEQEEKSKWREVHLDPFVREELLVYLKRYCTTIGPDGNLIYCTPWFYIDKNGETVSNKLFSFRGPEITAAYWWKIKERMRAAGFDVDRLEKGFTRKAGDEVQSETLTYVLRPHMWRHFATTIYYQQHHCDIISAQHWIGHDLPSTTSVYLHSPEELGSTRDALKTITWQEITGYDMEPTIEVYR